MTLRALLRQPTAHIPLVMSCAAFLLIAGVLATAGVTCQADEGGPARVFQLLLALQMPIAGAFAFTWLPRAPRPASLVLALQIGAAASALGTVAWLERCA